MLPLSKQLITIQRLPDMLMLQLPVSNQINSHGLASMLLLQLQVQIN